MAGLGLVKGKARVDVLKKPLSDTAALERAVDSCFCSGACSREHDHDPPGCPQPKILGGNYF